jgi:hypothetical protein
MLFLGLPRPCGSGNPAFHSEAVLKHDQRSGVFAAPEALARLSQRPSRGAHHPRPRPGRKMNFSGYKICNLRVQPKTAFSRFPPVPTADLEGQQR